MPRERIADASAEEQRVLFGPMDRHLRAVRDRWGVRISARREELMVDGDDAAVVRDVAHRVRRVLARLREGQEVTAEEVDVLLLDGSSPESRVPPPAPRIVPRTVPRNEPRPDTRNDSRHEPRRLGPPFRPPLPGGARPEPHGDVVPRTATQQRYVRAIRSRDVVFAVGPAGTGKTYLAVAEAVGVLRSNAVRKIVLTRPAVEAGEKLGYLPGDFHAKINPYLRPLYDALGELLPHGEVQRYVDADIIEIVPLAYMRGRTLKSAFIILDEGQNTTPAQMKMFLTRMGEGSKVVVTGDITQVDLPEGQPSGLIDAIRVLDAVGGLEVVRFDARDIQRHEVVQRIVDAYEREDRGRRGDLPPPPGPPA